MVTLNLRRPAIWLFTLEKYPLNRLFLPRRTNATYQPPHLRNQDSQAKTQP